MSDQSKHFKVIIDLINIWICGDILNLSVLTLIVGWWSVAHFYYIQGKESKNLWKHFMDDFGQTKISSFDPSIGTWNSYSFMWAVNSIILPLISIPSFFSTFLSKSGGACAYLIKIIARNWKRLFKIPDSRTMFGGCNRSMNNEKRHMPKEGPRWLSERKKKTKVWKTLKPIIP